MSLLVSVIYLVLGFLRFGFVTHFLSRPIISAFLTAGTIIISLSQVRPFYFCLTLISMSPLMPFTMRIPSPHSMHSKCTSACSHHFCSAYSLHIGITFGGLLFIPLRAGDTYVMRACQILLHIHLALASSMPCDASEGRIGSTHKLCSSGQVPARVQCTSS